MTLTEIGGFIVVASGAAVSIFGVWRAIKADRNSAKAAQDAKMVTNFQGLYDEQEKRIDRLNESLERVDNELIRVKNEQADERAQWAKERMEFQRQLEAKDQTIVMLTKEVSDLKQAVAGYEKRQDAINKSNLKSVS